MVAITITVIGAFALAGAETIVSAYFILPAASFSAWRTTDAANADSIAQALLSILALGRVAAGTVVADAGLAVGISSTSAVGYTESVVATSFARQAARFAARGTANTIQAHPRAQTLLGVLTTRCIAACTVIANTAVAVVVVCACASCSAETVIAAGFSIETSSFAARCTTNAVDAYACAQTLLSGLARCCVSACPAVANTRLAIIVVGTTASFRTDAVIAADL